MGKNVSSNQWRALGLLVVGSIMVASQGSSDGCAVNTPKKEVDFSTKFEGLVAVMAMIVLSGYSSIYFESILKLSGEKLTIWERNFQLSGKNCTNSFLIQKNTKV